MQSILMVVWFILVNEPTTCELRAIERTSSTCYGCQLQESLWPKYGYTSGFP